MNTKDKILKAAGEVFGEKGFKAATVREICRKAGVNQALVNYHFKSKKVLYNEIFEKITGEVSSKYPVSAFVDSSMTKEQKLRGIITLLMTRAFGEYGLGSSKHRLRLLSREMIEPTEAMDNHIIIRMSEVKECIASVVFDFIGSDADRDTVMRHVLSIAGQCLYPLFASEAVLRSGMLSGDLRSETEELIEHIYTFSLGALLYAQGDKK